ncbi:hypothetical protein EGW08_017380 [Elysia chlorotica]|uniref:EGF-like domain-containing protein n=1 Tax=Elysia chlorotica TaxID=188477 RepID=A0A3S0ZB15_ELYCH|nr:hypothetical protein EGW08_017380 [Elysia chlorotica]
MKSLCLSLLICAVLGLTTAYWMDPGAFKNSYADDGEMMNLNKSTAFQNMSEAGHPSYANLDRRAKRTRLTEKNPLGHALKRYRDRYQDRDLCIPWRSPCTNDEDLKRKYSFLKCCDNMSCKCSFWGSNCKCTARLWAG